MSGFSPDVPYGLMFSEGFAVAVVVGADFLQATGPIIRASEQRGSNLNLMTLVTPDVLLDLLVDTTVLICGLATERPP